jgi:hypothetical protein
MITETWCNNDISNALLNVDGYYINDELRKDRNDTHRGIGGGLLVYVRNDVIIEPDEPDDNCLFNQYCRFKVFDNSKKNPLNVTLSYRSPNSSH